MDFGGGRRQLAHLFTHTLMRKSDPSALAHSCQKQTILLARAVSSNLTMTSVESKERASRASTEFTLMHLRGFIDGSKFEKGEVFIEIDLNRDHWIPLHL